MYHLYPYPTRHLDTIVAVSKPVQLILRPTFIDVTLSGLVSIMISILLVLYSLILEELFIRVVVRIHIRYTNDCVTTDNQW